MGRQPAKILVISIFLFVLMHVLGAAVASWPYVLNALVTSGIVIALLILSESWYTQKSLAISVSNLGFKRIAFHQLVPAIIVSCILLLCFPLLSFVMYVPLHLETGWYLNLAGLCLTAGLMEESFFRGFIFRHLRLKMSFRKAGLWSMVFFACTHLLLFTYMDWPIALVSTMLAIASSWPLAYLFEKGQNTVWGPAMLHIVIRMIGMVIAPHPQDHMRFSMYWIIACMIIPYAVLLFWKDFRTTFPDDPSIPQSVPQP